VLAIRDAGGGGGPYPEAYDTNMAAERAPALVAPVSAPPPVPLGLTTSQVAVRVDFALAR